MIRNTEVHAEVLLSALTFGGCSQDTTVITAGKLTINNKGEVFISERRVETKVTSLPTTCFYGAETGPVKIGTLTGGSPATIKISTTSLQRLKGSNEFFCAIEATWTGSYLVTIPATLLADFTTPPETSTLTSPAGSEYAGEIHMTLESGTSSVTKAGIENKCTESTAKGIVSVNTEVHAEGVLSTLTFGGCSQDTTVINPGKLTINNKGEVFISERRVENKVTSLGITCFYGAETGSVKVGTLTGGSPATLDINTTSLQRLKGSNEFFCAKEATWTGSYLVTTPATLFIK